MISIDGLCSEAAGILQFVGWILTVFKIAIPLLIIFFGVFDFGKAVVSGKDDEIKKNAKSLMWRAVAGVIIFFLPTIVMWFFSAVAQYEEAEGAADFEVCQDCILEPWNCSEAEV